MFYTHSPGGYQGLRILKCRLKTLSPCLGTAFNADGVDGRFGLDRLSVCYVGVSMTD